MNEDRIKVIKTLLDDIEGNQGVENNSDVCHDMLIRCVGVLKGLVDDYGHNDSSSDVDSLAENEGEQPAAMSLKILGDMISHAKSEYARIKNTKLLDEAPVKVKKLCEYKNTYASVTKGKVTCWLVFNREGLAVEKVFENFPTCDYEIHNINTKTPYLPFGYNTTDTDTVELAVQLAKEWDLIKRCIGTFVDETNKKSDAYMNVLTNFKL